MTSPTTHRGEPQAWMEWLLLVALPTLAIASQHTMPKWAFMWVLAFSIFAGLKWLTWRKARSTVPHPAMRSAAYLLAWPGMNATSFLDTRHHPRKPTLRQWLWAVAKTTLGILLLWALARRLKAPLTQGWIGLLGLIFLLHFGSFHLLALFWQAVGFNAQPIMSNPALSQSLGEFWGKRWNLGFRQLSFSLVFRPLEPRVGAARATFVVFVASGLLHDLVISLPAQGGYGLPTGYFILQGLGVLLERSHWGQRMRLERGLSGRMMLIVVTCAPVFWLFHPPFVVGVIVPFLRAIRAI